MKYLASLLLFSLSGMLLAQEARVPEIPFTSVADVLKLPPDL